MNPRSHGWLLLLAGLLAATAGVVRAADSAATAKSAPAGDILTTPADKEDGYSRLGFDRLAAFPFTPPDFDPVANPNAKPPSVDGQIPESIRKFDGQKAIITGFMLPVRMEEAFVVEFMLVRTPALCCYGVVPNVNEWVVVKMKPGANIRATMDTPVSIYGTLHVHGQFDGGYLSGIYVLDGERMEMPKPPAH